MKPSSVPAEAGAEKTRATAVLAGRPNTGKSTLFNALTGMRQRVGNFAGCTVERAEGILSANGREVDVVDLPGTFSIVPGTEDEQVAFRFLSETAALTPDFPVFCVAEASNLQNDLALAVALRDCGYHVSLVINMIDEAERNGIKIDAGALGASIRLPVYLASARDQRGLAPIKDAMTAPVLARQSQHPPIDFRSADDHALKSIHRSALKEAHEAVRHCVSRPHTGPLHTISESIRIDRWLFHPIAGPLILAGAMFAVFESLFILGGPVKDGLTEVISAMANGLRPMIPSALLAGLICDGIIAGVSAVVTFLPQIAILFLMIGFLEQSGYLPRAGAMVDRALRPFGLDGKVFIPFLSSFACAIPGVMATRTISSPKRRLAAVLLCPLMTCSARIPVYTLIIAAFVPATFRVIGFNGQGVVMAGMYLFGIVMALFLALLMRATPLYEASPSPVTVLPPYRFPKAKELARYTWVRCWHFLSKAGQVIFTLSILLWALGSFPRNPAATAALDSKTAASLNLEYSALGRIGHAVEPVFKPIGYDWKLSVAVISSLAAREVFVGTLGTIYALGSGSEPTQGLVQALRDAKTPSGAPLYTVATAVSLLIFFAIALQCVSTIAVVRRETGSWKWPAAQFTVFFAIAYSLSWAGYTLTSHLLR
jgi:ferrous iron transport protein B